MSKALCPNCGTEGTRLSLGFIPMVECPKCGTVADIEGMSQNIEAAFGPEVNVVLSAENNKDLVAALKRHPDFSNKNVATVLAFVKKHATQQGTLTVSMLEAHAELYLQLLKREVPEVKGGMCAPGT